MVPPIPQAAWAAPSSTNSAPALSLALGSNVKYQLENGKTYTLSNASVSNTVIEVLSGRTATVKVPKNVTVTINDYGNGCSPINVVSGGKLTLIVDGTLEVIGGAATHGTGITEGGPNNSAKFKGRGGFAGISVPNGAELNVYGSGQLIAKGGDAGHGGDQTTDTLDHGGTGGGGAGAGIGGNGGDGGQIGYTEPEHGSAGGAAGTIKLYGNVLVEAYGGGGGSGRITATTSGGGGGGYPGAGIGGGGAGGGGGTTASGAGGFSGGGGEQTGMGGTNGGPGGNGNFGGGGGYFQQSNATTGGTSYNGGVGSIGGGGSTGRTTSGTLHSIGGNGGAAGGGGTVTLSDMVKNYLKVANGSYQTNIPRNYGKTPTPIYAQSGYDLALVRTAGVTNVNARTKSALESELGTKGKSSSIKATALAGVGSGAGYTESSNGSFTI
ncbi:MAG: hypothetical protein HFI72_00830, partial [Peptococcaceae bacterium]|nr:hypothetical protein [Peptococcaceae bacterium]